MDTASLWTDTRLEALVEQAVGKKAVNQLSLVGYAIANIFSTGLRSKIESLFTHNEGVLSATYDVAVRRKLIEARGKLDIVTLADPIVASAFRQANSLSGLDVASHVVSLFTGILAVSSQLSLYRLLTRHNRTITYKPIIGYTITAALLQYLRWFYLPPTKERSKSTHTAFQRLNELWSLSCQAEVASSSADMKLLNLQNYLLRQFDLAIDQLGGTPFIRNVSKPLLHFTVELSAQAWPIVLRTLFALQALRKPQSIGSLSQLSITVMCARKIAASLSNVISTVDDIRSDCTKIKAFYEVMDVESMVKDPVEPLPYTTQHGLLGSGMKIEFRNVSFGYRGENGPMALSNLSFVIPAGALVCVVGGNGAGKSTLIKLLTRLYEPTSGEILVNDQPISAYSHSDLLKGITVQLQHVPVNNVTIAEFVGMGAASQRPDKRIDVAAVKEALSKADAMPLIDRLDKGIWARLGPFPPRASARTVLSDALWFDEQVDDEWDLNEPLATAQQPISTSTPAPSTVPPAKPVKRDTTWSLNLSGGEWAKICFARSLMKDADLRIFDEPAAALDAHAQQAIFRNIEELRGKQSIVHVTHHIRSAISADLVLCLKNGELVEQGTHYDLISISNGFYRSLAEVQMPEAVLMCSTPLTTPALSGISTPSDTCSDGSSDSGFFDIRK
ncbi:P-loop containing nucleoside triphosphate hydrolase protein [Cystobasidium minutum MCA 4210]|uniref:P-loop containing nucleoside triphosphate hydrolase protein n=1 Tax=Cystobasidium minutum MCA 4210 TaxID=1397322 RepID=UPI0034CDE280|eukprot:jgi/Rhomi1/211553/estExt_Genemark1.C_5_t10077